MTDEEIIRWFRHVEPPTSPHSFAELQSIKFPEFISKDMERAYMTGVMECADMFLHMYRKGYARSSEAHNIISRWASVDDRRWARLDDLQERIKSWWTIRRKVLAKCNSKCTLCGSDEDLEIHHIVSVKDGGTPDLENLTAVCFKCHRERKDEATDKDTAIHSKRSN
jgi:5-methylcytosine-specific restriction endonuclease McrA